MAVITAQRIIATVSAIGRTRSGDYGEYQPVLFESSGLEGGKLWRNLKPAETQLFRKGQQVELSPTQRNGRDTWDIRPLESTTRSQSQNPVPTTQTQAQPEMDKAAVASHVTQMARLYAYCIDQAAAALRENYAENVDEETIRCAGSSIFIATTKKFGL